MRKFQWALSLVLMLAIFTSVGMTQDDSPIIPKVVFETSDWNELPVLRIIKGIEVRSYGTDLMELPFASTYMRMKGVTAHGTETLGWNSEFIFGIEDADFNSSNFYSNIITASSDGHMVVVATEDGSIYTSYTNGHTWQKLLSVEFDVTLMANVHDWVYMATSDRYIYRYNINNENLETEMGFGHAITNLIATEDGFDHHLYVTSDVFIDVTHYGSIGNKIGPNEVGRFEYPIESLSIAPNSTVAVNMVNTAGEFIHQKWNQPQYAIQTGHMYFLPNGLYQHPNDVIIVQSDGSFSYVPTNVVDCFWSVGTFQWGWNEAPSGDETCTDIPKMALAAHERHVKAVDLTYPTSEMRCDWSNGINEISWSEPLRADRLNCRQIRTDLIPGQGD